MAVWLIYLVRCGDGSLYTGITTDVARRFAEHAADTGASYTRGRAPLTLVFQRSLGNRGLALTVEYRVKHLPKAKKEELIRSGKHLKAIVARAKAKDGI